MDTEKAGRLGRRIQFGSCEIACTGAVRTTQSPASEEAALAPTRMYTLATHPYTLQFVRRCSHQRGITPPKLHTMIRTNATTINSFGIHLLPAPAKLRYAYPASSFKTKTPRFNITPLSQNIKTPIFSQKTEHKHSVSTRNSSAMY